MKFLLLFLLLGTHVQAEDAGFHDLSNVSSVMDKAGKDAKNITLPVNKHTKEGKKAAKQTADTFYSPEFQDCIQCEQQRLEQEVFKDYITSWKKQEQKPATDQSGQTTSLADTEKVYLFFSSSVPKETVHAFLADIARVGDPNVIPVMRGLVKGMGNRKAGAEYFSQILKKDPDCRDKREPEKICPRFQVEIRVNPPLFTKYGITRVPAVVYVGEKDAFIIQGDSGLDYLLERINRQAKSTSLDGLIKKMRGGH